MDTAKNLSFQEMQQLLEHQNNLVVRIEKDGHAPYRGTFETKPAQTVEYSVTLTPNPPSE